MESLHYPRPCACKGVRTCLKCEKGDPPVAQESLLSEDDLQRLWQFCNLCGKVQPPPHTQTRHDGAPSPGAAGGREECPTHHRDGGGGFIIRGIQVIPDFITREEEEEMVGIIQRSPWRASQSGRYKQDYGPKPNFKRRKVKQGAFTGLPAFSRRYISRMTQLDSLMDFIPVEQCHLEYTPDRGSAIDLHFDDFWLWGNRLVTMNLLSDTFLLLKLDEDGTNDSKNAKTPHMTKDGCHGTRQAKDSWTDGINDSKKARTPPMSEDSCHGNGQAKDSWTDGINDSKNANTSQMTEDGCHGNGQAEDSWTVHECLIPLPRRSLIVLSDDARYKWKHAIPRNAITSRRIAVTLRELAFEFLPGGAQESVGRELLDVALSYDGSVVP